MSPIRLYIIEELSQNCQISLNEAQAHYLFKVMRRKVGDEILLFNGINGLWISQITEIGKNSCVLIVKELIKPQEIGIDFYLCYAPVKNTTTSFIVQKATELGVSKIKAINTKYTIVNKINKERLEKVAIEAAEQCERLTIPIIDEIISLKDLLKTWDINRILFFCDESGKGENIITCVNKIAKKSLNSTCAIIIGPEGGFSEEERDLLNSYSFVQPVSLGPRILKSDTAIISALSIVAAILGDW